MSIIISPAKYLKRGSNAISLVLAAPVAAAIFATAALAAPPLKSPSVAIESGSGSLQTSGSGVYDDVEFVYGEVRHVSLTLAYYSDASVPVAGDLFAGPVWTTDATTGRDVRSKAFYTTTFPGMHHADDFEYLETQTVEFDADRWKIELISLSFHEKYVWYKYTVTFPKP